jgi:hypothetical protein
MVRRLVDFQSSTGSLHGGILNFLTAILSRELGKKTAIRSTGPYNSPQQQQQVRRKSFFVLII